MKLHSLSVWALGVGLVLAGCQVPVNVHSGKGHVVLGASRATADKAASRSLHAAHPSRAALQSSKPFSRSLLTRARDLSASQDIDSMSYTVTDLSGIEADQTGSIDPTFPFVDLFLTPGGRYQVNIDVTPTSAASRPLVGVTKFGDRQTFTVDPDGFDTYVDLYLHPVGTPVVAPFSSKLYVADKTDSYLGYSASFSNVSWDNYEGARVAYGAEGRLYYLSPNYGLFEITNFNDANTGAREIINSTSAYMIYAFCPDPVASGLVWTVVRELIGEDYVWSVKLFGVPEGATATEYDSYELGIDPFNPAGLSGMSQKEIASGIAVDLWGNVYLSYYNTDTTSGTLHSGVLALNSSLYFEYPSGASWSNADSVITDIQFAEDKLFVLGSPASNNSPEQRIGRATVWGLDANLDVVWASSVSADWDGSAGSGTSVWQSYRPHQFQGLIEGGIIPISTGDYRYGSGYAVFLLSTDELDSSVSILQDNS